MRNYWVVTCCYNFIIYMISMSVYYAFGRYVSGFTFFTESNPTIIWLSLIGWGLNQVALSFLFASFLDSSQTATMVGYAVSIMATVGASTVCLTVPALYHFSDDNSTFWLRYEICVYPAIPFCRIWLAFSEACAWKTCMSSIRYMPEEIFILLKILYAHAFIYFTLAVYLN